MNLEQVINKLAELFDQARPLESGIYVLVVSNRAFVLRRPRLVGDDDIRVTKLTASEINYGLTLKRWNLVGEKACQVLGEMQVA